MAGGWPLLHHVLDDFTEPWAAEPAPVVLFHHGLAGNGRLFLGWVPAFADRYRTLRIDARGQGQSPLPEGYSFSLDGFVADALAVMDHLSIERVHWVGSSGGGIIGQHAAITAPERIASLSLIATTARFRSPTSNLDEWLAPLDRGDTDEFFRQDIARRFGEGHPTRTDWIIDEIRRTPPETIAALHRWVCTVDLSEQITGIRCPALIVTGEHDTLTDLSDAGLMAERIPSSQIHVIKAHPHNVGYTHPMLVGTIVRRFVDTLPGSQQATEHEKSGAYLGATEGSAVTTDEARSAGALTGLFLPEERARQLAGTLSGFLEQQQRLRAVNVADYEPTVMTFESEQTR
jgi:pimeloyl-ACP methyl ester carboxylesterase